MLSIEKISEPLPFAGSFDTEEAYNPETDKLDKRKVKIPCPNCKQFFAPLCSTKTELMDSGLSWAGDAYQYGWRRYKTTCRCGQSYKFCIEDS